VVALKAANANANDEEAGLMTRRAAAAAMLLSASASLAPLAARADDTSLDFSLPTYDAKMSGFGEGKEAYLKTETVVQNGNEKEKQREAMAKAEEARKEALARKKAEQKEREEETKRRALEKKARDAERLKNIWNS
jgi:paraquat-inducible protein B